MPTAFSETSEIPLKVDVLAAVKYAFEDKLRDLLMEIAKAEVDKAVEHLSSKIEWSAVMSKRPDRMDTELVVTLLDKRQDK